MSRAINEDTDRWDTMEDGVYEVILYGQPDDSMNGVPLPCRHSKGEALTWCHNGNKLSYLQLWSIVEATFQHK
jgi:hypothetical protein